MMHYEVQVLSSSLTSAPELLVIQSLGFSGNLQTLRLASNHLHDVCFLSPPKLWARRVFQVLLPVTQRVTCSWFCSPGLLAINEWRTVQGFFSWEDDFYCSRVHP